MICCNPLKTSELWHHEIFGHEIHGFLSTFEKAMKCHFHGYFMASRSLYSIFHGSWIWKFSQVFHGIFQVFFMALRPWKCHWFNHEYPVKNLWIYNELFHKIFMGFEFIVLARGAILGQWSTLRANKPCNTVMIPLIQTFRHLSFWVSNKKGNGYGNTLKFQENLPHHPALKRITCLHDGKLCACTKTLYPPDKHQHPSVIK